MKEVSFFLPSFIRKQGSVKGQLRESLWLGCPSYLLWHPKVVCYRLMENSEIKRQLAQDGRRGEG
jgi:hypothetical protein